MCAGQLAVWGLVPLLKAELEKLRLAKTRLKVFSLSKSDHHISYAVGQYKPVFTAFTIRKIKVQKICALRL